MRRLARIAASVILMAVLLPVPTSAHSGRTDANGGHTDHSTGEYHYHHGYPAHDHYDMDGDGDRDCPYNFDYNAGQNFGSAGSQIEYQDGYDDGYQKGYRDGAKDIENQSKSEIKDAQTRAVLWTIVVMAIIGVPAVIYIIGKKAERERAFYVEKLKEAETKHIRERNAALLNGISPGTAERIQIPDGVRIDTKYIPIKGTASASRPYGDYTAYISANGKKYHYKRGCSGATKQIHVFDRPVGMAPCANCVGQDSAGAAIPDWYLQLVGRSKDRSDSRPSTPTEQKPKPEAPIPKVVLQSTEISAAEYSKGVIYITFADGANYAYHNVPRAVYDEMIKAPSTETFFCNKIKDIYPCVPYHE